MDQIKNVIVLGKGSLAIKIANWFKDNPDYNIICVVPVIPEPTWTDFSKIGQFRTIYQSSYLEIIMK